MNTQAQEAMKAGVAQYNMEKPAGDIDLVAEVRDLLRGAGLGKNVESHYDSARFVMEARGKTSQVQRFLLNRYWTQQLSMCPNSMDARYNLIPNGEIHDWLRIFKDAVLPFLVQHSLPREVSAVISQPATTINDQI